MPRLQGDLPQRSFRFALRVLDLVETVPQGTIGWVVGKQLARCGTAIGANVREADDAMTEAEFAYTCNVARKEAAETQYWLELCQQKRLIVSERCAGAIAEANELQRILGAIVRKVQTSTH